MRYWRAGLIVTAFLMAVCLFTAKALAHSLAQDGDISAFMHINQNDVPVPGQKNSLHFFFNDKQGRFTTEGCFCNVEVRQGKAKLYDGMLPAASLKEGYLDIRLPIDNFSYDVIVSGTPKTGGFFQSFKLKFDIDVGHPPPETQTPDHKFLWLATIAAIAVIGTGLYHYKKPARRSSGS